MGRSATRSVCGIMSAGIDGGGSVHNRLNISLASPRLVNVSKSSISQRHDELGFGARGVGARAHWDNDGALFFHELGAADYRPQRLVLTFPLGSEQTAFRCACDAHRWDRALPKLRWSRYVGTCLRTCRLEGLGLETNLIVISVCSHRFCSQVLSRKNPY